jgi:PAS domain S-box-containing protein
MGDRDCYPSNRASQPSVDVTAESDTRLQLALKAARMGVWDWEIATGKLTWSDGAETLLGLPAHAFGDRDETYFNCIHPSDRHHVKQTLDRALERGGEVCLEHRVLLDDGSVRWLEGRGSVVYDRQGNPVRMMGTVRDITDRKQAEVAKQRSEAELQRKATELESAFAQLHQTKSQLIHTEKMSSLGQLVAGVAHEINNPVNFIYGNISHARDYIQDLLNFIELLHEEYKELTPALQSEAEEIDLDFVLEDLPKLLSSMEVGAARIRQIVLSLRNFSRMEDAKLKAIDIHDEIETTLLLLHNRTKAKAGRVGIEIVKEYGNLPPVSCYPGQLNQVFMNLIANAIDALEEYNDGRSLEAIKADPGRIQIRTQAIDSQRIRIQILDNGSGIPETVRDRLFDPFFTTKPAGKGTGLGLSISYQIVVEKHGGQLQCHSSPGQGAEFIIDLPVRPSDSSN